jgi:hypothetical protein
VTPSYRSCFSVLALGAKQEKEVTGTFSSLPRTFLQSLSNDSSTFDSPSPAFPSLFLDLCIDGIPLYDREGFFGTLRDRMRKIISSAGLSRKRDNGEYHWVWKAPPKGGWEITWSGYREF